MHVDYVCVVGGGVGGGKGGVVETIQLGTATTIGGAECRVRETIQSSVHVPIMISLAMSSPCPSTCPLGLLLREPIVLYLRRNRYTHSPLHHLLSH